RWLRYWVNPYADQYRKTALEERLLESEAYRKKRQQALDEEARLLYVGITRARDQLIFVSRDKPMKWLNRVWHEGNESYPTIEPGQAETPWQWNGQFLQLRPVTFTYDKSFEHKGKKQKEILHIEASTGQKEHPTYKIDLREENWEDQVSAHTGKFSQYAMPLPCEEEDQKYTLGKSFKAFLIADYPTYSETERLKMAQSHLDRFELDELLEAQDFLKQSDAFYLQTIPKNTIAQYRKYVLQLHWEGRLFDTVIDFVYITDDQIIFYQNSGFTGDPKRWRKHAVDSLGAWNFLVTQGLQQLLPNKSIEGWVHFVLGGTVIRMISERV
ncbi:MAG: 3'-5' exonuclease, partial [Bacteroidota bacterium]